MWWGLYGVVLWSLTLPLPWVVYDFYGRRWYGFLVSAAAEQVVFRRLHSILSVCTSIGCFAAFVSGLSGQWVLDWGRRGETVRRYIFYLGLLVVWCTLILPAGCVPRLRGFDVWASLGAHGSTATVLSLPLGSGEIMGHLDIYIYIKYKIKMKIPVKPEVYKPKKVEIAKSN